MVAPGRDAADGPRGVPAQSVGDEPLPGPLRVRVVPLRLGAGSHVWDSTRIDGSRFLSFPVRLLDSCRSRHVGSTSEPGGSRLCTPDGVGAGAIATAAVAVQTPVVRPRSRAVGGAAPAVAGVFTRPDDLPALSRGRGQERLGGHLQPQLGTEIHQEQAVVPAGGRTSGAPAPRNRARRRRPCRGAGGETPGRRAAAAGGRGAAPAPRRADSAPARSGRASTASNSLRGRRVGQPRLHRLGRQTGKLQDGTSGGPDESLRRARACSRRNRETGRGGELLALEDQRGGRAEELEQPSAPDAARGWSAGGTGRPGPSWRPGHGSGVNTMKAAGAMSSAGVPRRLPWRRFHWPW